MTVPPPVPLSDLLLASRLPSLEMRQAARWYVLHRRVPVGRARGLSMEDARAGDYDDGHQDQDKGLYRRLTHGAASP